MDNKQKNRGLLLTNLGTPSDLQSKSIREFLVKFLMDKYIIDFPYVLRFFLVHGIIVPSRTKKSLAAYKKIWMKDGSPLMIYSKLLQEKTQSKTTIPIALSMRYGNPSTENAFKDLLRQNPSLDEVIVLPLYPHYTMSSLGTAVEEIRRVHKKNGFPFKLRFINAFYNDSDYITSLAESIRPYLNENYDKILFSYHGIPERHIEEDEKIRLRSNHSDYRIPNINYRLQVEETSRLVAQYLNIPEAKYEVSFQSRLIAVGVKWLSPYTADRLYNLPKEGCKKVLVVCPAFVSDCLETLEEIGIEGKKTFMHSGGTDFKLIPCINNQEQFADTIIKWAESI